jgi:hypothetical protein
MKVLARDWKAGAFVLLLAIVAVGSMACGGSGAANSPAAPALLTAVAGGTGTAPDTGSNGNDPGSGGNGSGPCDGSGTCTGPCDGTGDCTSGNGPVTAEVLDALNVAIQDEYHAEFVYLKVTADFGEVQPFSRIINAEERHSEAIGKVFTNHGLPIPASDWNLGNVPSFGSLPEACAAGVEAETANIALYDELLALDLPQDARNVFTNIRAASLLNHLPAFEACCLCNQ